MAPRKRKRNDESGPRVSTLRSQGAQLYRMGVVADADGSFVIACPGFIQRLSADECYYS